MWKYLKISLTEQSFENIKYGSYPKNYDFNNLSIEYKKLKKTPIDCLNGYSVEGLKVSSVKRSLDNRINEINPQNYDFVDLPFDGDEKLLARIWLYSINDDIIFKLINGLSIYV